MKKTLIPAALLLAAVLAVPAFAQNDEGGGETSAGLQESMLRAIVLPLTSGEARKAGVAEEEIRKVLAHGRQRSIPPDEIEPVLREEVRSVKQHGPIDNFGAFVQDRLDQGLRGRELASAIRSEHESRGKGLAGGETPSREAKVRNDAGHRDREHRKDGNDRPDKGKVKRNADRKKGQDR